MDRIINDLISLIVASIVSDPGAAFKMGSFDQYHLDYNNFNELVFGITLSLALHTLSINDLLASADSNPFANTNIIYIGTSEV